MYICRQSSINKLFHIGLYSEQFIARYWVMYRLIFQISAVFCCKRYGERFFSYGINSRQKKRYRLISRPTWSIFKTGLYYVWFHYVCKFLRTQDTRVITPYRDLFLVPKHMSESTWILLLVDKTYYLDKMATSGSQGYI